MLKFNSREIAEPVEVEVNGEQLKFTYRRLSRIEEQKVEKEILSMRKTEAKLRKYLKKAEDASKSGKDISSIVKNADPKIKDIVQIYGEIQSLNEEEDGEKIIDLEEKLSKLSESIFDKDKFAKKIYNLQFGGEDKDRIIEFLISISDDDRNRFYDMLNEYIDEKRAGKHEG